MRQYSSDQQELAWNGLDFKEGFGAGTFIAIARNVDSFTGKPQANGKLVSVFNPDLSGTVTVTIDQESTLHQKLIAIAAQDRSTRDQVFNGKMTDVSSGHVIDFSNMRITRVPDQSRSLESTTFDWVFQVEAITDVPNEANTTNLVGS